MNRLFLIIASMFIFSCFSPPKAPPLSSSSSATRSSSSSSEVVEDGLLIDSRDGKKYKITTIGKHIWMAENLSYNAKDSKCYNDENSNCKKYGRLYSWETIKENLCPDGWRLPSNADWNALVNFAGGEKNAGNKLKAKSGWNNSGNGSDDYGFAALPGGHASREGKFSYMGDLGLWWNDNPKAHSEFASNWYINARGNAKNNDFFDAFESNFSSIRCIKKDKN